MTRSELIEMMARAMVPYFVKGVVHMDGKDWRNFRGLADTALTAIEEAGMVVVPAEPTEKMLSALQGYAVCAGYLEEGYRAMIAARPTALKEKP